MLNKFIGIGNLGSDPEMKYLPNGNAVVNFTVATSERWMKDGERQEKTTWHRCVAYGKLAEICEKYLHKGKQIYFEGKIDNRSYEQNGERKYISEIIISQMQMLGGKGEERPQQQQQPAPQYNQGVHQPQYQHNQSKANGYQPQQQGMDFPQEQKPAGEDDSIPF